MESRTQDNKTQYTLEIDGIVAEIQGHDWSLNYGGYNEYGESEPSTLTTTIIVKSDLDTKFIHKFRCNSIYNNKFKLTAFRGYDKQIFTGKIICVSDLRVNVGQNWRENGYTTATFTLKFYGDGFASELKPSFGEKRYDIFGKQIEKR